MKNAIVNGCVAIGLSFIVGCATSYDEDPIVHMDFKSRAVVEDMASMIKGRRCTPMSFRSMSKLP